MAVNAMKMHSFFFTNKQVAFRKGNKMESDDPDSSKKIVPKPKDCSFTHFSLFMLYPILVFEFSYPRKSRRNWLKLLQYFVMMWLSFFVTYMILNYKYVAVYQEYILTNFWLAVFKLGVSTLILYLTLFYGVFHCFLNFTAELLLYSDRKFYEDWWNVTSFEAYYIRWNTLVHEWFLRHIYIDTMRDIKFSKTNANLLCFVTSALWHEFILTLTFKMFRPYISVSMFFSILLISITKHPFFKKTGFGNLILWIGMTLFQSMMYAAYARSWYLLKLT
ncbi:sterol o-acyltransferase [Anaeramoeba ignava]|uniref:Sterol o-acyltransferase n=1 Tax=Anaeramoeba ignava TaxID=1746090 RepID=A0A9Q0RAH7_ANAIG|nr:sterol o-acyltransferase [Anaeramoeba ignava]